MPKVSGKPKAKRRWSGETIRRRGVRAVVDAMRLSKQCQQLSREHACHMEEIRIISQYLRQVLLLNKTLRQLVERENDQPLSNGNTWMSNGASHSQKRTSRERQ
jgi:hypothetical protein